MTDEEYPVLTQWRGTLDYAKIAEIRNNKHGCFRLLGRTIWIKNGLVQL
jgi:hypothetical protein